MFGTPTTPVRLLRHCFLDEAADVRQAGVGSARAARLDRRRVRIQANDAHALVRLNAGGGHRNCFFELMPSEMGAGRVGFTYEVDVVVPPCPDIGWRDL